MSVNFLERQVLRRGHQLVRFPQPEYGCDALMWHCSAHSREIENGQVEFQVKATDHLRLVADERFVTCTVETGDLHNWYWEVAYPVILVLYDAEKHRAFWLDVQAYVEERGIDFDAAASKTVTLRIPTENGLSLRAIDRFRDMSLARMETLS